MKVKFKDWNCKLAINRYMRGNMPAISLVADGEPIAMATINLDIQPPEGSVWIKDYSENEGMANALIAAGVIEPAPTDVTRSNFVVITAYRLTAAAQATINSALGHPSQS